MLSAGELGRCGHHVDLIGYHPGNDFVEYICDHSIRFARTDATGSLRLGRIRAMVAHLLDGEFDIAHCFGGTTTVTGSVAGSWAGVPVVAGYRMEYREHGLMRLGNPATGVESGKRFAVVCGVLLVAGAGLAGDRPWSDQLVWGFYVKPVPVLMARVAGRKVIMHPQGGGFRVFYESSPRLRRHLATYKTDFYCL